MSTVFRIVKNENYTTMSNFHFKDKRLSWKAKGLLSVMLSLPEDWNYTIEGLAKLSEDGIKSTTSGLAELKKYGYLVCNQLRNENGSFGTTEYIIYEQPVTSNDDPEDDCAELYIDHKSQPICQNGITGENAASSPICQNRRTDNRRTENGSQLNTNILNTKELNISSSIDEQNRKNVHRIQDEEEENLRKRLEIDQIAKRCSKELTEAVFKELCKRDEEFIHLMNIRAMEQVCFAVMEKQRREPIRMLPNLINTYLDNIMIGIKAAGGGNSPPAPDVRSNRFNEFKQNQYDFAALEQELLSN